MWLTKTAVFRRVLTKVLLLLVISACSSAGRATPTTLVDIAPSPSPRSADLADTAPVTTVGAFEPSGYRLQPGEMILAAEEDNIPAILADDTLFVDAGRGSNEWQSDDLVIGVAVEGDARAYPVRLLSSHEIVNDVVGGRPIVITWCPLCFSALVFDRVVDDRTLTFGVSGYLFRNNLVMYDHQTNTYWSQLLAQGIRGALNGEKLTLVPTVITEWASWKDEHPETTVLSAQQLGKQADKVVDPYAGYYASGIAGLTGSLADDRLPAKELVVGLVIGDEARAYPLPALKETVIVNDQLASVPLLLLYDADLQTVYVYHRKVGNQILIFEADDEVGSLRDVNTGSLWDVRSGVAVEGTYRSNRLHRLSAPLIYWFAWSGLYRQTELWTLDG